MSQHLATVQWQHDGSPFAQRRYSRRHRWQFDGGLQVPASSSPDVVPLPCSDPSAVDPEEAFVAALASCHMLWFLDLASRAGWAISDYEDAAIGHMGPDKQGRTVLREVLLRPVLRLSPDAPQRPSQAELEALHHQAHEACFLANSVRCTIRCEPRWAD
ncbi:OsmC family protein [Curvibacter sp. RS43]|jgi:organic hydroperoxide reductase OsmC/OhrA|uniref:OsmC family protein n=1 Tax=Curvibacter microcysteis TaxID=3026419 RepID=UPI0023613313|nr:OsmC family protein [Curvibacter sp. RS43]MDD0809821.1 OsmC family protein [Curvibacter sp. RS43]